MFYEVGRSRLRLRQRNHWIFDKVSSWWKMSGTQSGLVDLNRRRENPPVLFTRRKMMCFWAFMKILGTVCCRGPAWSSSRKRLAAVSSIPPGYCYSSSWRWTRSCVWNQESWRQTGLCRGEYWVFTMLAERWRPWDPALSIGCTTLLMVFLASVAVLESPLMTSPLMRAKLGELVLGSHGYHHSKLGCGVGDDE